METAAEKGSMFGMDEGERLNVGRKNEFFEGKMGQTEGNVGCPESESIASERDRLRTMEMAGQLECGEKCGKTATVEAGLGRSVVSRVVKKGDRHTLERNVRVKGEEKNGEAAEMYPFPQKRFSAKDQRPMASASAAAEAYYCTRDARARLIAQSGLFRIDLCVPRSAGRLIAGRLVHRFCTGTFLHNN